MVSPMTHLSEKTQMLDSLFSRSPLLPLLNIERLEDVLPLADALAEGGITTLEITLRTALGIDAIALLRSQRPALTVGAGTVLAAAQEQGGGDGKSGGGGVAGSHCIRATATRAAY